jgi:hypothetical protein
MSQFLRSVVFAVGACVIATDAFAACTNKFLRRTEGPRQVVTLLTGKLTFQEAQALSAAITKKEAPPIEWVDEKGKVIARQYGDLRIVRPMPVGCDGKTSGVIFVATFTAVHPPAKKMFVKLTAESTVEFEEQSDQAR